PGLDVEVVPGELALHIATKRSDVELVRVLLKRARANPDATNSIGTTPLMVACSSSRQSCVVTMVRLLLEAGAKPALTDKAGHTALHIAAHMDLIDVVDML
ncbi:unnamed protein product, partial [Laminaria digitata]